MTTAKQPLYVKRGDQFLLSPAAVLLLSAEVAENPDSMPAGRRNAVMIRDAFLAAAQTNGYTRRDIFLTIAAAPPSHERMVEMAREVVDFIPVDQVTRVLGLIPLEDTDA